MVLKRILLIFVLLLSMVKAETLFYTDNHLSNFYLASEEKIVFYNNVFALMHDTAFAEVEVLMESYFDELGLETKSLSTGNNLQIAFSYEHHSFDAIAWSKTWFQDYEVKLNRILKEFLRQYFEAAIAIPSSIEEAAIVKVAYYDWQNYGKRRSEFTKTKIHFSVADLDINAFNRTYIPPNLSLGRIVTSSFENFYNEAYPIQGLEKTTKYVLGPSHKARLIDCISMHIYAQIHKLEPPKYIVKQTVLVSANEQYLPTETEVLEQLPLAKSEVFSLINDMNCSLYSFHDKRILADLIEAYTYEDYTDFEGIYFKENSYNLGQPVDSVASCFSKSVLKEEILFKANSIKFVQENDSLMLNSLVQFLQHNPLVELLIIGTQDKDEYTKIDKEKYKALVESYDKYPPVKSSKRADLAIYRAVVIFDYLAQHGVHPKRISCLSGKSNFEDASNSRAKWVLK